MDEEAEAEAEDLDEEAARRDDTKRKQQVCFLVLQFGHQSFAQP